MSFLHRSLPFALAGAVVATIAMVPGAPEAQATPRNAYASGLDHERPLTDRGPFFGLRVNSMDVKGDAITLACFEYTCDTLVPSDVEERYLLVRHGFRDMRLQPLECDEILTVAFRDHDVRLDSWMATTRWIRPSGPSGTPIGGFVGQLHIFAVFECDSNSVLTQRVPLIDLNLIGTQGMRPGRDDLAADEDTVVADRCDTPRHDEGFYLGGFNKKGLRQLYRLLGDDSARYRGLIRKLSSSVIAGTFEGTQRIAADASDPLDFCRVDIAGWWFDGLLGYRCRRPPVDEVDFPRPGDGTDRPETDSTDTRPVDSRR